MAKFLKFSTGSRAFNKSALVLGIVGCTPFSALADEESGVSNAELTLEAPLEDLTLKETVKKDELLTELKSTVNGLNTPARWKDAIKIPIDVTTQNKETRFYTRQGFGLMQSQWDIEAHRCFVYALEQDSECIGAYIGLLMMSGQNHNPSHFLNHELIARVDQLKKRKKEDGSYYYSEQERLYADVFIALAEKDRDGTLEAIDKLVTAYPMDFQALIMRNVLLPLRSGGNSEDKKSAYVNGMIDQYPYNPLLWVYWLAIHQYDNDPEFIKNKIVPVAKKLVKWAPDMPIWHIKYGKFLEKAGMYDEAQKSFERAHDLYDLWGRESNIPLDANTGIWQSKIFQSVCYLHSGDFDASMKLAKELQSTKVDFSLLSEVRGVYLWEVQSLPARLYLARNKPGDLKLARESLPKKELLEKVADLSAASMYYTGLRQYIAFRMLMADEKIREAEDVKLMIDETNQLFQKTSKVLVNNFVDKNYFYRGKVAVNIYQNHANAELEKAVNNMKGYDSFMEHAQSLLHKYASLSILPRHVIEDIGK